MGEEQLHYEKRDSIEVTRNAKGEYGWKVKLYFNLGDNDYDTVLDTLTTIDTGLRGRFSPP